MCLFKNIKPGGYVRSGLARMSISFYIKPSGDCWFPQKSPWGQFPFIFSGIELPLLIRPLNHWSNNLSGCKEAWHPRNLVCVCVCVCGQVQGRKHTDVSRNACIQIGHQTPVTYSNPAISAEHWAEVPSSSTESLASISSCCHLLGQLSVKVVWGGGSFPLRLIAHLPVTEEFKSCERRWGVCQLSPCPGRDVH